MKMSNREIERAFQAAATGAILLFVATGCQSSRENASQQGFGQSSPPVVVHTSIARVVDVPQWLDAAGTVSSELSADISTRMQARVTNVLVKEGDRVRKGQVLIELDARDLDAAIAQARSDVNAANVAFQSAVSAARMTSGTTSAAVVAAQAQVEQARAVLANAKARCDLVGAGPRSQERAEAAENVAKANAAVVLARKTYERMANLYKNDAISGQQLDVAKSDYDAAQASYDVATQARSLTDEGSRREDIDAADAGLRQARAALEEAKAGLAQAKAASLQVSVRQADVRQAQAQIRRAQAALCVVLANRSYATIIAPFDGVVSERLADPGAMAGPGSPLLRIQGGALRLSAVVPESEIDRVHRGQALPVTIDALGPMPIKVVVEAIAPQGDASSHTFIIKTRLPAKNGVRAGMYGKALIKTGVVHAICIPSSAIVSREGLNYVYVIQFGIARLRLVTTGASYGGQIAVQSGLSVGEMVAISHVDRLADNERVAGEKQP